MVVGVPEETRAGERRVAVVPKSVEKLRRDGLEVLLQRGAGTSAGFPDAGYESAGARLVDDRGELFAAADIVVQVNAPGANTDAGAADLELLRPGQLIVGLHDPLGAAEAVRRLAGTGATGFALELLPRISRAQPMDALSSQATVGGYRAALLAATRLPKLYPMMITAAGTVTPARVFVIGAGVAGLQAIATSRRLGAVVEAYDVRPAVREQVESLGARFVELALDTGETEAEGGYARAMDEEFYRRQRELMAEAVAGSDAVITTAAVPGKRSPLLLTEEAVRGMRPGSVIVDLAAAGGGNCELTRAGETVEAHGVTIMGPLNLPAEAPYHASEMYARNVSAFLGELVDDGELAIDDDDPIHADTLLTRAGEVVNLRVRELLGLPAPERSDA